MYPVMAKRVKESERERVKERERESTRTEGEKSEYERGMVREQKQRKQSERRRKSKREMMRKTLNYWEREREREREKRVSLKENVLTLEYFEMPPKCISIIYCDLFLYLFGWPLWKCWLLDLSQSDLALKLLRA